MKYEFRELLFSITELSAELKAACDAYRRREISADRLKEIVIFYADQYPDLFFDESGINVTVRLVNGLKRSSMLARILNETQSKVANR